MTDEELIALAKIPARGIGRVNCPHCGPLGPREEHDPECPRYPSALDAERGK